MNLQGKFEKTHKKSTTDRILVDQNAAGSASLSIQTEAKRPRLLYVQALGPSSTQPTLVTLHINPRVAMTLGLPNQEKPATHYTPLLDGLYDQVQHVPHQVRCCHEPLRSPSFC